MKDCKNFAKEIMRIEVDDDGNIIYKKIIIEDDD